MVRIAAIGDNDVDCYLSNGLMYPGGNCYNVSIFARRFGVESAYIGAMANDPAGRHMRNVLLKERVDIERLRTADGITAYCVIGHVDGDRVFLNNDFGVSRFIPDIDDFEFLSGYDVAHVGQSSALDQWLPEIAERTALSYDFAVRHEAEHIGKVAPLCQLASVSTSHLSHKDAVDLALTIKGAGAQWVLATRGRDGAILLKGDAQYDIQAASVEAVDTLGAGDTFIARTLVGLMTGEKPNDTLSAAAKAAAGTCSFHGAVGYGVPIDVPVQLDMAQAALKQSSPAAE
ncbi:PfkB family carbohydrate kinase [Nitratireductor aquibiodomus]|uniref:Ribokinase-like domain-containing protein n=1 Tax=Nitratireductor aquibiodomus RA22 TaxID=1189611 RepID=I5BS57_9HYPH|nr:PfkB family carbohydrate kinase [Nitratireductor aquibiodomus]EIM72409.1 ribokinase-like domain-containing protein [Nitratireductor aquibiodomus RA22]